MVEMQLFKHRNAAVQSWKDRGARMDNLAAAADIVDNQVKIIFLYLATN